MQTNETNEYQKYFCRIFYGWNTFWAFTDILQCISFIFIVQMTSAYMFTFVISSIGFSNIDDNDGSQSHN